MNEATGYDNLVELLKAVSDIDIVFDSFSHICKLSLSTGHFPKKWKIANFEYVK